MAKSQLRQQIEAAAPTGDLKWDTFAAALEVLYNAVTNLGVAPVNTTADPGSDATKTVAVQGVTGGKAVPVSGPLTDTQLRASAVPSQIAQKQLTGVPSSFGIRTADETVFTLAAGEIGVIQNLSADAPLAVKKGAAASTISLNLILAAGTADSDGKGGIVLIDDWVGAVSVAKMTGTAKYLAWKQAA